MTPLGSHWTSLRRPLVPCLLATIVAGLAGLTDIHADETPGAMLRSLDAIRFEITLGRISAQAARYRHARRQSQQANPAEARETLSVNIHAGEPSLHYEFRGVTEQWTFDVLNGRSIDLQRTIAADGSSANRSPETTIRFRQPTNGDIVLTIRTGETESRYDAHSIWHLQLAQPDVAREHLAPLLHFVSSEWRLAESGEAIEAALLQVSLDDLKVDPQQINELIDKLRSPEFATRRQAMKELHRCGFAALPVLDAIDPKSMDGEQQLRIAEIRAGLSPITGDTPTRVATWLSCDQHVWLTLLNRPDEKTSLLAREQLARLSERPIDFEFTADGAERAMQVARVRQRLGLR